LYHFGNNFSLKTNGCVLVTDGKLCLGAQITIWLIPLRRLKNVCTNHHHIIPEEPPRWHALATRLYSLCLVNGVFNYNFSISSTNICELNTVRS